MGKNRIRNLTQRKITKITKKAQREPNTCEGDTENR